MQPGRSGRVILLNGPSSSGKSSVGRELQRQLSGPWFLFPVDDLGAMRSVGGTEALNEEEVAATLHRTRAAYHRAIAALASTGNDVIMDYPLSESWRLADLLEVLKDFDVTLVDLQCSPRELEKRERARGDRPVGLAMSQSVFDHDDRDITVDTTHGSACESADTIASAFAALPACKAFHRLAKVRD